MKMPRFRHRHHTRLHSRSTCGSLFVRRYQSRFGCPLVHQPALCRRRMCLHRTSRRKPAGINSLIEAVVYADAAAKHSLKVIDNFSYQENIPEWNDEGTQSPEEMVLITQSVKEVGQIMSTYVGIVRSDLRLKRAWDRLDILYEETESLFKRSKASKEICELRNMINTGYLVMRQAMDRKRKPGTSLHDRLSPHR